LDELTDFYIDIAGIGIDGDGGGASTAETVEILHSDYRQWYPDSWTLGGERTNAHSGRLLFLGSVRPYKGLPRFLRGFDCVYRELGLSARIVGDWDDPTGLPTLAPAAVSDGAVSGFYSYASDEMVSNEILECEAVVLPYLKFDNSGVLLLALSFGRPVLVSPSPLASKIGREVGGGWVFEADLQTSDGISHAVVSMRNATRADFPELGMRSWQEAGEAHMGLYRRALGLAGE